MLRLFAAVACVIALLAPAALRAQAPPDTTFYAVAYLETAASAARAASAAVRAYRDATAKQDGCSAVDAFEQIGRPGHWVVVETWRDQKVFDARDAGVQQRLLEAIKDIRVSDAHAVAPHTKKYRDDILPLTGSPLDERVFRAARD